LPKKCYINKLIAMCITSCAHTNFRGCHTENTSRYVVGCHRGGLSMGQASRLIFIFGPCLLKYQHFIIVREQIPSLPVIVAFTIFLNGFRIEVSNIHLWFVLSQDILYCVRTSNRSFVLEKGPLNIRMGLFWGCSALPAPSLIVALATAWRRYVTSEGRPGALIL